MLPCTVCFLSFSLYIDFQICDTKGYAVLHSPFMEHYAVFHFVIYSLQT